MMKRFVLLIAIISCYTGLRSQSFEVGVSAAASYYEGDLAPNAWGLYFQTVHPSYGVLARANVGHLLSFRLAYNYLTISGDDEISGRKRGLNFETNIHEISLNGELNLFRWHIFGTNFYVEPYGLGGVGVFLFNPTAELDGEVHELQPLGTEGQGLPGYQEKYDLTQWVLLGGGGIKLPLGEQWLIGLEGIGRITFFDHLDDVSNQRVAYQDVLEGNGVLAARLSRPTFDPEKDDPAREYVRGGAAKDYYFSWGMTLTYLFGPDTGSGWGSRRAQLKCPTF